MEGLMLLLAMPGFGVFVWLMVGVFVLFTRFGMWVCFHVSTLFMSKEEKIKHKEKWKGLMNG